MILRPSTILGLSLADRSVTVAELSPQKSLKKVAILTLPETISLDKDPQAAGQALRTFLRENRFSASRAVIGVPAKWLTARENEVPPAATEQVHAMLALAAERLSAEQSSDLVFDYAGRFDDAPPGARKVLLVAMLRSRLEQIEKLADAAGLSVLAVTPSALALSEAARRAGQDLPMLLLGRQGAEMVWQHQGNPRMLRHFSVTATNGHGVSATPLGSELRRAVALAPSLTNGGGNGPSREVMLWDAVGLSEDQVTELSDRIGVSVRPPGSLQSLGIQDAPSTQVKDAPRGQFAPAVALALAGADRTLLPFDFKHSRLAPPKARRSIGSGTSWAIVLGAVVLVGIVAFYLHVRGLENQLNVLNQQLSDSKEEWADAKKTIDHLDYGLGFFDDKRSPMLEALREVTLGFREDEQVWVNNFSVREVREERQGKYVRRGQITGKASEEKLVSAVADRLRANQKFADVGQTTQQVGTRSREVGFTITFTYTAPE